MADKKISAFISMNPQNIRRDPKNFMTNTLKDKIKADNLHIYGHCPTLYLAPCFHYCVSMPKFK